MKYIVALEVKSRYARPKIDRFEFSPKHERMVWRGEETDDIARLAELVNEANECKDRMDHVALTVRVYQVKESEVAPAPEPAREEPRALPFLSNPPHSSEPGRRKRPRLLADMPPLSSTQ